LQKINVPGSQPGLFRLASRVKLDFFGRSFGGALAGADSFKKMSIAQAAMERHATVTDGALARVGAWAMRLFYIMALQLQKIPIYINVYGFFEL